MNITDKSGNQNRIEIILILFFIGLFSFFLPRDISFFIFVVTFGLLFLSGFFMGIRHQGLIGFFRGEVIDNFLKGKAGGFLKSREKFFVKCCLALFCGSLFAICIKMIFKL